ncbi:MAG: cob(I)yrinic acid a,c-diamide adenosyltransferase [Saprospiraceae bacterium]|nr:cob(I)yrinic acid a,c-diamide adenosyltransferase [Saprospiraceae bacterium]
MAFKIYTKTGDKGETALFGGTRVPKNHYRVEAYGTVDELNAYVGMLRDTIENPDYRRVLKEIQDRLFTIGAVLASDPSKYKMTPDVRHEDIQLLENQIDAMEATLPILKNFILHGGHTTVSFCNIARTVCRRTERLVVGLNEIEKIDPLSIKYLNRLSDYLFVLGRKVGQDVGAEEIIWKTRSL